MKMTQKLLKIFGCLVLGMSILYGFSEFQQTAGALFEKALFLEEARGELQEAIELYQQIIDRYSDARGTAAKAQLHIGICYEKLGLQDAEKAFNKVLDNYPDQTEAVKLAREKLDILERARAIVEKEDQGIRMTQIPIDPEKHYYGFISPDAKKLAYVSMDRDIWIRDIASDEDFQLTKTEVREIWCAWSPDSKKIAFLDSSYNLYVVSAQGGAPKMLIKRDEEFYKEYGQHVPPIVWSSDCQKIYNNFWKKGRKGLIAVSVDGGAIETVYDKNCSISPNEKYLAYTGGEEEDIFIVPLRGGEPVQITNHPAMDQVIRWSYDGRWLLFGSDRNGNYQPWIMGISPEGKRDGEPFQIPFLTTLTRGNLFLLNWAKDGKIGLDYFGGVNNIFVANTDGNDEVQLTKMEYHDGWPKWSPDGQFIVYFSSREYEFGIYIMPGQGGEPKKVSAKLQACGGALNFSDLDWHPNGRSISCVVDQGDDRGMWTIDIESGLPQKIPFDYAGYIRDMDWSADGKWIAFTYFGANEPNDLKDSEILRSNIYTMSPEGGEPKRVTKVKEEDLSFSFPCWSPDGRRIAMAGSDGRIWLVGREGGEPQPMTEKIEGSINANPIKWSQDGKTLYFWRSEGQQKIYYAVSSDGRELRKMNAGPFSDITPDGKKLAYARNMKSIKQFWLLENFLPEKK
ncbi:tetratricopeptide repeat protein [Acidobacteriota bacterium]